MLELRNPKTPALPAGWSPSPETQNLHDELRALEARNQSLQLLVGELLVTNQRLRLELNQAMPETPPNAPATHPPQHPDR